MHSLESRSRQPEIKSSGYRLLREAEGMLALVLSRDNLNALNHQFFYF